MTKVVLHVEELACDNNTHESGGTRDEVYFRVIGDSSTGLISRRLPNDEDYFEFNPGHVGRAGNFNSWTNQDQIGIGKPILWAGELNDNEGINLFVVIGEQDNKDLGPIKRALQAGLQLVQTALGSEANPLVNTAFEAANGLINAMPEIDEDDVIGAFVVHLEQINGKLEMAWLPWGNYSVPDGRAGATTLVNNQSFFVRALEAQGNMAVQFNFQATRRGEYRGVVVARAVEEFTDELLEFKDTTKDQCGERILFVTGRNGIPQPILKGQYNVRIDLPENYNSASYIYWNCNGSNERTVVPAGANMVYVSRHPGRREITWVFYRNMPLVSIAARGIIGNVAPAVPVVDTPPSATGIPVINIDRPPVIIDNPIIRAPITIP